jgi:hypothetical protein
VAIVTSGDAIASQKYINILDAEPLHGKRGKVSMGMPNSARESPAVYEVSR